jgi:hypothetical protein
MTHDGNRRSFDSPDTGRALEFGYVLDPAAKEPSRDALTDPRQLP